MQPLQISAETAVMLSKKLNVPIEHLMHMPKHILLQKMAELAKSESAAETVQETEEVQQSENKNEEGKPKS